jgi:hypothetical protein
VKKQLQVPKNIVNIIQEFNVGTCGTTVVSLDVLSSSVDSVSFLRDASCSSSV